MPSLDPTASLGLSLAPRGVMLPNNLFAKSEAFDDAAWSKSQANIFPDTTTSPTGTTTADKITVANAVTDGFCIQAKPVAIGTYTLSVYLKAQEFSSASLVMFSSEDGATTTVFNIGAGTITSGVGTITAAANGFYRCSITKTFTGVTGVQSQIICKGLGNGASGIAAWGAQLETGSSPGTYVFRS